FKVDFVRRRVLPLLKNGATVAATPEDDAAVEAMIAERGTTDRELAVARAGCSLLDDTRANPQSGLRVPQAALSLPQGAIRPSSASGRPELAEGRNPQFEALQRWCAARVHDPAYRHWVVFRFPETVDPFHLVEV